MTRPQAAGEPSMEEILASIRKIIAEDEPVQSPDAGLGAPPRAPKPRHGEQDFDLPAIFKASAPATPRPLLGRLADALRGGPAAHSDTLAMTRSLEDDLADILVQPAAAPAAHGQGWPTDKPTASGRGGPVNEAQTGFEHLSVARVPQPSGPMPVEIPERSSVPGASIAIGGLTSPDDQPHEGFAPVLSAALTGMRQAAAQAAVRPQGSAMNGHGPAPAPLRPPLSVLSGPPFDERQRGKQGAAGSLPPAEEPVAAPRLSSKAADAKTVPPPVAAALETSAASVLAAALSASGFSKLAAEAAAHLAQAGKTSPSVCSDAAAFVHGMNSGKTKTDRPAAGGDARGRSVEALMAELLRPMVQQWLDKNMPALVQSALDHETGGEAPARGKKN